MVQRQAAALVGNEPQAAPLPGVLPPCCLWPWQVILVLPSCCELSFSRPLVSWGITEEAEASLCQIRLWNWPAMG